MAAISKIFYKLRRLLYVNNERGEPTGDIFRYLVRKKVRKILRGRRGLIIDIGCGEGYLLEGMLINDERKAVLFDNEEKMIATAVSAYHPGLKDSAFPLLGDARTFPFRPSVFDSAVCINTFYNFPSPKDVSQSIQQISLLLKPGGSLIFDIRNKANPFVRKAYSNVQNYDPSIGNLPLNAYTIKEIKDILHDNRLSIKRCIGLILPIRKFAPIILIEAAR